MKSNYIDRDRIIFSVKPKAIGLRPIDIEVKQFEDIYFNGLNIAASGSIYLTGTSGMFEETPILLDGVDSGFTGLEVDFEWESEYAVKVPDVYPKVEGVLDAIIVQGDSINQLTENYEYGFHGINVWRNI